eukprot:6213320-Pleurochrysis_carterae.AAC.5
MLRSGAFARWRMDAWCIGRKCGVIGQVVLLSMCDRQRAGAHPQLCSVRHRELGRGSSSCLAARDDIRGGAMVLVADVLKLCRVEWSDV